MIMSERNIEYLLEKYKIKDNNEIWSTSTETKTKRQQRNNEKHIICNILLEDLPLKGTYKKEVHYLIDTYTNFNQLNPKLSKEQIIGCFCYYVLRIHKNCDLEDYKVLSNLNINYKDYSIVITNMKKIDNYNKPI
jgi:hypothetical protein